jgi:hypothetical protein
VIFVSVRVRARVVRIRVGVRIHVDLLLSSPREMEIFARAGNLIFTKSLKAIPSPTNNK